ncbi:MAG: helix-turn-helix domain-containing protein [Actinobacteria bacterium]|nr:helix-turn-helix domain-containing protein [Actinomycetota bacterium]
MDDSVDAATSNDPAIGLRAVWALRSLSEQLERVQVANARKAGWTWQQIADALNVSRQAVHKKYARHLDALENLNQRRKGGQ